MSSKSYDWGGFLETDPLNEQPPLSPSTFGKQLLAVDDATGALFLLGVTGQTIPDITGQSGKFLTTNGSTLSWANSSIGLFSGLNFTGSNLTSIATRNFADLQFSTPAVADVTLSDPTKTFLLGASSIPNLSSTLSAGGQLLIYNPPSNSTRVPFAVVGNYRNGVSGERYWTGFGTDGHFTTNQYITMTGNGSGGGSEANGYMFYMSMDVGTGLSISAGSWTDPSNGRLISLYGTPNDQAAWGRVFEVNVKGGIKISNPYGVGDSINYDEPQVVFANVGSSSASPTWTYGAIKQDSDGNLIFGLFDPGSSSFTNSLTFITGTANVHFDGQLTTEDTIHCPDISISGSRPMFAVDNLDGVDPAASRTTLQISDAGHVKVYRALLTQTGTSAPTATVLENTIGSIVWTRTTVGTYKGTLTGAFTIGKTWIPGMGIVADNFPACAVGIANTSANFVTVQSFNASVGAGSDDELSSTPIEIRVYP
jgi:hypothetical protein